MKIPITLTMSVCIFITGCSKYLDKKPDKQLAIPSSLLELQELMDNNSVMNNNRAAAGEGSADNYYLTDNDFDNLYNESGRSLYLWGSNITYDDFPNDWSHCYDAVYYANVVLENVDKLPVNDSAAYRNVKGSALFFRACSFLTALSNWTIGYNQSTANTDLGIPLRLSSDFNLVSVRSSTKAGYEQVLSDLHGAAILLPVKTLQGMRPSSAAANAMLARCFLAMQLYDSSLYYAVKSLQVQNSLMDFNTLDSSSFAPVPRFNKEVFVQLGMVQSSNLYYGKVDSSLCNSYDNADLRRYIYFIFNSDGSYSFKGNYNNSGYYFVGPAVDEMYLTKAECEARIGNVNTAMHDLNTLLSLRWRKGSFIPFTATTQTNAISQILSERRKELLYRDIRWMDLKRLNLSAATASTIYRSVHGTQDSLVPNDLKYALPIPQAVIDISDIPQNPR